MKTNPCEAPREKVPENDRYLYLRPREKVPENDRYLYLRPRERLKLITEFQIKSKNLKNENNK